MVLRVWRVMKWAFASVVVFLSVSVVNLSFLILIAVITGADLTLQIGPPG